MDAREAYTIIKEQMNEDYILYFCESEDCYIYPGEGNTVNTIDKRTGEIGFLWFPQYMDIDMKPVYVEEVYDDFSSYLEDGAEDRLAKGYASIWNELIRFEQALKECSGSDKNLYQKFVDKYRVFESKLRLEIMRIITEEGLSMPPYLKGTEDKFYMLKPFMVRNGYTVSMTDKRWEPQ